MIELMIMSYSHKALVLLLLYLASSWLFAVVEGQKPSVPPSCPRVGDVQATTETERINGTCFVVNLTNIEVCENSGWREICDAYFTGSDAEVICRQLNYSDIGAVAGRFNQLFGGFATTMSPVCSGTESMLSECSEVASGVTDSNPDCSHSKVSVTCFPKGSDGSACGSVTDTTTAADMDSSSTAAPSTTPSDSTSGPTPSPGSTSSSSAERPTNAPSVITDLQSQNEQPNIVIILASVGTVFVLALLVSILLIVILVGMCYRRAHREKNIQISPDSPVKVRKADEADSKDLEPGMYSELNNSNTVVQHQPIYDTVKNKSQNLSEASVSENNEEDNHTYAALNQDAIYTQIAPHLGSGNSSTLPAGLTGLSSASSYYQKLDRTRSLPRTPGSGSSASFTQTHAVNRTALALESGNIEEADLASPMSDASMKYPSPRGSPKQQRPSPRGSPKQRLSSTHSSASKDESPLTREPMNINPENFYHVLDPEAANSSSASSERDRERYDIDSQVSTDAVCNLGEHDNRHPQCYVGGGAAGGVTTNDGGPPLYAILEPSARVQLTPPTRHDTRQRSQSATVKNRSSPPHQKRSFSNSSNREAVHNFSGEPRRTTGKYIQPSFQSNVPEIIDVDDPQMDTLV